MSSVAVPNDTIASSKTESVVDETVTAMPDNAEKDAYPTGLKLIVIISALLLAVFLVALDQTIVATAIPKITDRFHSVSDIGWYGAVGFLSFFCRCAALISILPRLIS
jgi:Co/Zn/Cd efflux system component